MPSVGERRSAAGVTPSNGRLPDPVYLATSAIGSCGTQPGPECVEIETWRSSSIGVRCEVEMNKLVLASSRMRSMPDKQRFISFALWGGATISAGMRPRYGSLV